MTDDLQKAEGGNKAASQRVRTGTVRLEKVAKLYRKESIKTEKLTKGTKKTAKKTAGKSTKSKSAKGPQKNNSKTSCYVFPPPFSKTTFRKELVLDN